MQEQYGLIFDVDGDSADTERVNAVVSRRTFADLFGVQCVVRENFEAGLGLDPTQCVVIGDAPDEIEVLPPASRCIAVTNLCRSEKGSERSVNCTVIGRNQYRPISRNG